MSKQKNKSIKKGKIELPAIIGLALLLIFIVIMYMLNGIKFTLFLTFGLAVIIGIAKLFHIFKELFLFNVIVPRKLC